ncbi:hypothetical protein ACFO0N_16605 [Halobium salinum]|uniref:DUF7965 domain-containing protein n=1 Tax=Halobium salinum TaxID=1364940 RepID=A0ABD5PF68_9EURY|nr:hypothetical protein [Halobium salinum]
MADAERSDPVRLRDWALATLHTTLFVLLPLLAAFAVSAPGRIGDVLGGLDTSLGLALFAYLWLVLWLATRRALAAATAGSLTSRSALRAGLVWGAVAGVGFVGPLLLLSGLAVFVTSGNVFFLLVVAGVGSLVATVVGAVLGLVFAAVDFGLLAVARRLAGVEGGGDHEGTTGDADPPSGA